jgi:hypothetical protein
VVAIRCVELPFLLPLRQGDNGEGLCAVSTSGLNHLARVNATRRQGSLGLLVAFQAATAVRSDPVKGESTWVFRLSGNLGSKPARLCG